MADESELVFDFHGVGMSVACDDAELRARILNDFSYFRSEAPPAPDAIAFRLHREAPDYDGLPAVRATIYSPRNVCYPDGSLTYIDYFGKALTLHDRDHDHLEVWSPDLHLLHEIVYLSTLSLVCGRLERRGLHRVHALCVESAGRSALFMMPSGGGKTTLCLEFLRRSLPLRIVSEDSPLIDSAGRSLPFPLRLGVKSKPEGIAEEHLTYLERMEFDPKYLISLAAFEGHLAEGPSRPVFVFIGERTLGRDCSIREVGAGTGLKALLRHMIVGVGLYQGVEFLLRSSVLELFRMSRVILSRGLRALTLVRNAQVLELELGLDPERNTATILDYLDREGFLAESSTPSRTAVPAEASSA